MPSWLRPRVAALALAAFLGTCVLALVFQFQDAGYKAWVVLAAIALLPAVLALTGHPRELLLFGWVFSLTYNRQYFVFERLVGYNGTQGPYVILADVCLAALFGLWAYERVMGHPPGRTPSAPLWPWYLPFAAACFLTIFDAARPDWAAYEMLRVVKIGLVLFYVRHNMGRREWRMTLAALGVAVCFQSAVAIKEVVTGKAGVIGASQTVDAPEFLDRFDQGAFTGMVRGQGTMAHPPYLACYLLLALPVLLAIALTGPRTRARAAACAFLLGCAGLAATLSRWPGLLAGLQFGGVMAGLVLMRQLPVQRALGTGILATLVLAIGLLPVGEKVMDRLTGDLAESVEYREAGIRASMAAIGDHPLLGLGLNNTAVYLGHYLPEMEWALVTEEFASRTLHLRAPVSLGNGFTHIAEETGILGALGFFLLVAHGLTCGARAMTRVPPEQRAVCLGLLVGMLGALAEQVIDTPLWVDPNLYTFVLFIGLLHVAGGLFAASEARAKQAHGRLAAA